MEKCKDCEFCFENKDEYICVDAFYGQDITVSIESEKECYSESFDTFYKRINSDEFIYPKNTKLESLKIHKSKRIYIYDLNKKIISLKFKHAIEMFKDVDVIRNLGFDDYLVKCFFDEELMKGSNYLVIKDSK